MPNLHVHHFLYHKSCICISDRYSHIQFDIQILAEESVCAIANLSACQNFFEHLSLHIFTESGLCKVKCYPALFVGSN